jgi:putative transposase
MPTTSGRRLISPLTRSSGLVTDFMLPAPRSPDGRTIRDDQSDPRQAWGTAGIMPVTNPLERLNEEIKRRAHVVASSPTPKAVRLVRALAVERHENWLEAHRYLNMDDLREHKKEALRMAAWNPPTCPVDNAARCPQGPLPQHHDQICRRFSTQLAAFRSGQSITGSVSAGGRSRPRSRARSSVAAGATRTASPRSGPFPNALSQSTSALAAAGALSRPTAAALLLGAVQEAGQPSPARPGQG